MRFRDVAIIFGMTTAGVLLGRLQRSQHRGDSIAARRRGLGADSLLESRLGEQGLVPVDRARKGGAASRLTWFYPSGPDESALPGRGLIMRLQPRGLCPAEFGNAPICAIQSIGTYGTVFQSRAGSGDGSGYVSGP